MKHENPNNQPQLEDVYAQVVRWMSNYEDPTYLEKTYPQTLLTREDTNKFLLFEANDLFTRLIMTTAEHLDNLDKDGPEAPF